MPGMENAFALVVGIAHYSKINPLPATVLNDARAIAATLASQEYGGYRAENVWTLLDQQATGTALRQHLAQLAQRCDSDSVVFIYISGHGGQVVSGPYADNYLLPVDVDYTSAETLARTAISGVEFAEALWVIPARKLTVVFDCCYAGGIGQPKSPAQPVLKTGLSTDYYATLHAGRGRVILASSREDEVSWIMPCATHSLFSQHMLDGLRGGVASDDGLVKIFDLFEYVQPRVTGDQPLQHPVFKAELEQNFPVALYPGGQNAARRSDTEEFRYDAYISYADTVADADWVWKILLPKLKDAGLRVAVSGDVEEPGVDRVVNMERGITRAKRTVVVLSPEYLADQIAVFQEMLAHALSLSEGSYRLLPVKITPIDPHSLPLLLSRLDMLDMTDAERVPREFERMIAALRGPLPYRRR